MPRIRSVTEDADNWTLPRTLIASSCRILMTDPTWMFCASTNTCAKWEERMRKVILQHHAAPRIETPHAFADIVQLYARVECKPMISVVISESLTRPTNIHVCTTPPCLQRIMGGYSVERHRVYRVFFIKDHSLKIIRLSHGVDLLSGMNTDAYSSMLCCAM